MSTWTVGKYYCKFLNVTTQEIDRNCVLVELFNSSEVGFTWRFMINKSETSWTLLTVGHNSPSPDACLHRITSSILEVLLTSACRNGSKSRYCTQRKPILRGNVWTYGHEQNCSFNLVPGCEWIHTYGTVTVAPLWNTSVPTNFLSATGSTLRAMLQLLKCLTGQTWQFFGWRFCHVTLSWNGSQTRFIISFSSANSKSMIRSSPFPYRYCKRFADSVLQKVCRFSF